MKVSRYARDSYAFETAECCQIPVWQCTLKKYALFGPNQLILQNDFHSPLSFGIFSHINLIYEIVPVWDPYTFTDCNTMCWPDIPLHIYRLQHDVLAIYPLTHLPIETRCVGRIYIPLLIANCNTMIWSCLPIVTHCVDYVSLHTFTYCITICWPCVTS